MLVEVSPGIILLRRVSRRNMEILLSFLIVCWLFNKTKHLDGAQAAAMRVSRQRVQAGRLSDTSWRRHAVEFEPRPVRRGDVHVGQHEPGGVRRAHGVLAEHVRLVAADHQGRDARQLRASQATLLDLRARGHHSTVLRALQLLAQRLFFIHLSIINLFTSHIFSSFFFVVLLSWILSSTIRFVFK